VPCDADGYNAVNACRDIVDPDRPVGLYRKTRAVYKDQCDVSHNKNTGVRCKWKSNYDQLGHHQGWCTEKDVTDLDDTDLGK